MAVYAGWEAEILLDNVAIGEAQGITFEVSSGLEAVYELGTRQPPEFKQGKEEITGTIDKLHVDKSYVQRIVGDYPAAVTLKISPKKGLASPAYTLNNVYFETVGVEIGAEDLTTESVDFRAGSVTIA